MKRNKRNVFAAVILLFMAVTITACGGKGRVEKLVKTSMQNTFETNQSYKQYDLHIDKVKLVKSGEYTFNGIVYTRTGKESYEIPVAVTYDGADVLWQLDTVGAALLSNLPKSALKGRAADTSAKKVKNTDPNPATDFKYDLNKTKDGVVILRYTGDRTDVVVPAEIDGYPVTEIADYAFVESKEKAVNATLSSVVLPNTVSKMGIGVFQACASLKEVVLPGNLTEIPSFTFDGCTNLVSVNLPAGLTEICAYAFYACSSLTSITIPEGLISIGGKPIARKIESDGRDGAGWVFASCKSLTSVVIPESVTMIYRAAFRDCTALTDIVMPSHPIKYLDTRRSGGGRLDDWRGAGRNRLRSFV